MNITLVHLAATLYSRSYDEMSLRCLGLTLIVLDLVARFLVRIVVSIRLYMLAVQTGDKLKNTTKGSIDTKHVGLQLNVADNKVSPPLRPRERD